MTEVIYIDPDDIDFQKIQYVGSLIRMGKIVALPTETVYGLACNLDNHGAVQRLYEVKQRPEDKRFTLHCARKSDIDIYARDLSRAAYRLIEAYWPGPLTLICRQRYGDDTVGVRCPDHRVTSLIIEASFSRVGMPSANVSGKPPCLSAAEVSREFDGVIDVIVDSNDPVHRISSTIVDVTGEELRIVREGAIAAKDIGDTVDAVQVMFVCTGNTCRSAMAHHYLEEVLRRQGQALPVPVRISSCGTMAFEGASISENAAAVLEEDMIDDAGHRSRRITLGAVRAADIIIAMSRSHRDAILDLGPSAGTHVLLLTQMLQEPPVTDVPDPMGGTIEMYRGVFGMIKEAVPRIWELIVQIARERERQRRGVHDDDRNRI
jgi:L-threonylcarbamoyladenylate synthase